MSLVSHHKVVSALPSPLEKDSVYYVRKGAGFDVYVTNSAGTLVGYEANYQAKADNLTALAGLTGAADQLPYFAGAGALSLTTLTAAARTLLAATGEEGQRTALGLGTAATATVTTNINDTTTGRLLKVGDYGVGGASYSATTEHLDDMPVGHNWRISGSEDKMVARGAPALLEGSSTSITQRYWNVETYGVSNRITQIASEVYGLGSVGSGRTFVRTKRNTDWNAWLELLTPKSAYLGTAATKNVGTAAGNVMETGAGGWLSRSPGESYIAGYPQSPEESISQIYRRGSSTSDGVVADAARIHFATLDTWGRLAVLHSSPRVWVSGGLSTAGTGWTVELKHSSNTTVDANGFLKAASPIARVSDSAIEGVGALEKLATGHYRITQTQGLRLGDGWYIETPHDRNGEKYFNLEWYQNFEPDAVNGYLHEPVEGVELEVHCFERVWNPATGRHENGAPVDIPAGRWIDLRFNEVTVVEEDEPEND